MAAGGMRMPIQIPVSYLYREFFNYIITFTEIWCPHRREIFSGAVLIPKKQEICFNKQLISFRIRHYKTSLISF